MAANFKAVSPSRVTPGLYLLINLLAGAASPGQGPIKVLLIAPKSSAGDLTADTEIRAGAGPDSASSAFGPGTPGHLTAIQIYWKAPAAQVYFASPTAVTGTATLDLTPAGVPTANNAVHFDVMGREFDVEWLASEAASAFRTRALAAFGSRANDLACVATAGSGAVITINSKVLGNLGEDIKVKATLKNPATGTESISGAATFTPLAGATTDVDMTTVLAAAAGIEFAYILPCISGQDAESASANNVSRLLTHIGTYNSGLNAKLQQGIVASTTTLAAAKTATAVRNSQVLEHVLVMNGRSLPCEFAGRELGGRLAANALDVNSNRIGEEFDGVYGSADIVGDTATDAELEDALTHGVSICNFSPTGTLYIVRPITTYWADAAGNNDRRLLDVQNVDSIYAISRDLRSALPAQFKGVKVQKDSLPGEEPPAPGVVEERDIRGFLISRLRFYQRAGVILKSELDLVIENGDLSVLVDESDASQVNIVLPVKIVPPLAKFGVAVLRRPN